MVNLLRVFSLLIKLLNHISEFSQNESLEKERISQENAKKEAERNAKRIEQQKRDERIKELLNDWEKEDFIEDTDETKRNKRLDEIMKSWK